MNCRQCLFLVLPFFLLFLDHQIEGRYGGGRLVGKDETSGKHSGIVNKELGSSGGQQGGAMVEQKGKRKEKKQIRKSRQKTKNEKKRKRSGLRTKTRKNRNKSKKYGKGKTKNKGKGKGKKKKGWQKKKKQKNKKKQKKKKAKKKQKKDKKKEKRKDNDRKHNTSTSTLTTQQHFNSSRSCSVDDSCIVNAQTVMLYEKNQVIVFNQNSFNANSKMLEALSTPEKSLLLLKVLM